MTGIHSNGGGNAETIKLAQAPVHCPGHRPVPKPKKKTKCIQAQCS